MTTDAVPVTACTSAAMGVKVEAARLLRLSGRCLGSPESHGGCPDRMAAACDAVEASGTRGAAAREQSMMRAVRKITDAVAVTVCTSGCNGRAA